MSRIKKAIKSPYYAIGNIMYRHCPHLMSDKFYTKIKWRKCMGYNLNLRSPRSFNEKLQYLKLYDRNPLYTTLVDKYLVKQWVAEKIGNQYVIPTLAVYDSVEEIDLNARPNQFVLKCNHDSGSIVICKDKSSFDFQAAKEKLDAAVKTNYFWETREWPYKNVKPRIIAEEYREDASGELRDYKVYAVNGRCDYVMLCFDRSKGKPKFLFYDREWNLQKELSSYGMLKGDSINIEKPHNLDKFFEFAQLLSQGIPFVRVDFYEADDQLFFGEMTFYPSSGLDRRTKAMDDYLNKHLILKRG